MRKTSARVRIVERLARAVITIGGLGTIAAVGLIFAFLVWVVVPLFGDGELHAGERRTFGGVANAPVHWAVDEYRLLTAVLAPDGVVSVRRLSDGSLLEELRPFGGRAPTAVSGQLASADVAFGFADGTVRIGRFGFVASYPVDVPPEVAALRAGESIPWKDGVVERLEDGQLRAQRFQLGLEDPIEVAAGERIVDLDFVVGTASVRVLVRTAAGEIRLVERSEKKNFLTGEVDYRLKSAVIDLSVLDLRLRSEAPVETLLYGQGENVILLWRDGALARYQSRELSKVALLELVDVLPLAHARVTSTCALLGRSTLVVGDSLGTVRALFPALSEGANTSDGSKLVTAHEIALGDSAVTVLSASPRTRLIAAGHADGTVAVAHITSGKRIADAATDSTVEFLDLRVAPKEDALFALTRLGLVQFELRQGHPEATMGTLFAKVWYEGYGKAEHVWQSASGTDDFEPKLGLTPLVYGTLKATFYSMLFGVPLALLAALYTSEFLERRFRSRVKSTIELMASLPSVVLGFFAALFLAPLIQDVVPETLASFFTIPLCLLLGAFLWQLLPAGIYVRFQGWQRLLAILLAIPAGLILSGAIGPFAGVGRFVEQRLFAGDIFQWLDGQRGGPLPGWLILTLPLALLAAFVCVNRFLGPLIRARAAEASRRRVALLELAKFLLILIGALVIGWVLAAILGRFWDPRGSFVGTYVQRNALIVGFVMGFAIVPIIYTLAEDALSSVPDSLRQASLSAGATPWQTALRVVVPTAASGLFSAIMIGLGRAVGETMIVLMATGNTAVMEWNMFNGFRTLSANIAVELPEAVQGSTHYRTLFLAALVLFLLTFLLNTLAETVRQRFRKRAFQL